MPTNRDQIGIQDTTIDVFASQEMNDDFISLTGIAKYKGFE